MRGLGDANQIRMYESTVREEKYSQVVYSSTVVQWSNQKDHAFKISIIPHLQVMKGWLTPCRLCTGIDGLSRLQIATSLSVEFLAFKLLAPWHSLTSVYISSSHSRVPSETLTTPRISLTSEGNGDRPQYVRISCPLMLKMMFNSSVYQ